jgi:DNA-binding FadR family transcriptional regulator
MPARTDLLVTTAADKAGEARLSSSVYEQIYALIASGEFPLNARLPAEAVLAQRFGASRPVIREALARLRDEGVIVSRQGSGSYVRRQPEADILRFAPVSSIEDIERCLEFRAGVEGSAAALAAMRAQRSDINAIRQALAEMETCAGHDQGCLDANDRFHLAVAQATRNAWHIAVQTSLQADRSAHTHSPSWSEARWRLVQEEHLAIAEAIEARDSLRARAAMEIHINNARYRTLVDLAQAAPPK